MNIDRIARQYRRPAGFKGYQIAAQMEENNVPTYAWLLPRLDLGPRDKILEIGFGTGCGLHELARKYPEARLYGIDFSRVMCRLARKKNRPYLKTGRMRLDRGDVLDYEEESDFDIAFCMNVIYFWKNLPVYFSKLRWLLKPGGKLQIYMAGVERLSGIPHGRSAVFEKHSLDDVTAKLRRVGFTVAGSQTNETPKGPAYLVTAVRP
jgi:SAM-dependent methyltransferase